MLVLSYKQYTITGTVDEICDILKKLEFDSVTIVTPFIAEQTIDLRTKNENEVHQNKK